MGKCAISLIGTLGVVALVGFYAGSQYSAKIQTVEIQKPSKSADLKLLKTQEQRQKYLDDLLVELNVPEVDRIIYDPESKNLNDYLKKLGIIGTGGGWLFILA